MDLAPKCLGERERSGRPCCRWSSVARPSSRPSIHPSIHPSSSAMVGLVRLCSSSIGRRPSSSLSIVPMVHESSTYFGATPPASPAAAASDTSAHAAAVLSRAMACPGGYDHVVGSDSEPARGPSAAPWRRPVARAAATLFAAAVAAQGVMLARRRARASWAPARPDPMSYPGLWTARTRRVARIAASMGCAHRRPRPHALPRPQGLPASRGLPWTASIPRAAPGPWVAHIAWTAPPPWAAPIA